MGAVDTGKIVSYMDRTQSQRLLTQTILNRTIDQQTVISLENKPKTKIHLNLKKTIHKTLKTRAPKIQKRSPIQINILTTNIIISKNRS